MSTSNSNNRPGSPREYDILCGKNKLHAKHGGNRIFRKRIDAMKIPYIEAPSKQEKMEITKEIVTYMQTEYGSRFLKMEGDVWVEIPNQAARDKVSHALRFAARNFKKSTAATDSPRTKKRTRAARKRASSGESCSSNSTTSSPTDSEHTENNIDEAVPLTQVFGTNVALNVAARQNKPNASAAFSALPDYTGFPSHHFAPTPPTDTVYFTNSSTHSNYQTNNDFATLQQRQEDAFVALTRRSLGSLQLDDQVAAAATAAASAVAVNEPQEPFNTLRSEDLNEILNEPLDVDEWEVVARLAEC